MEFRQLDHFGLKVPVLSFGTVTFGGRGEFLKARGQVARLDAASDATPAYPYWHQRLFVRNPKPV